MTMGEYQLTRIRHFEPATTISMEFSAAVSSCSVHYEFEGRPKTSFLSPYRDLPASYYGRGHSNFSADQGERSRALI
jgi:hypothetical protein